MRIITVAVAVAAGGGCFGCLAYGLWSEVDKDCMQFMERGLYGECSAPMGSFILGLSLIFAAATAVLAYLALRRR